MGATQLQETANRMNGTLFANTVPAEMGRISLIPFVVAAKMDWFNGSLFYCFTVLHVGQIYNQHVLHRSLEVNQIL